MKKYSLVFLLINSLVFAQDLKLISNGLFDFSNDFNNTGTARFSGMAGSMGALGGDLTAMEINPAGGGVFLQNQVAGSININSTKSTTSLVDVSNSYDSSNVDLSNLGGILVFDLESRNHKWKNFNIGINYRRQNINREVTTGENSEILFAENNDFDSTQENFSNLLNYTNRTSGSKSKFTINLSTNYDDKIFLGANLNFHSTDYLQESILEERDLLNRNSRYISYEQDTPYNLTSNGFSMDFGIIAKVNQMLRLGLAYQTPVYHNLIVSEFNYYDYDENFFGLGLDEGMEVTAPSRFSGSAALVIGKNLALNADVIYHLNTSLNLNQNFYSNFYREENNFIQSSLKNTVEYRLGGEYRYEKFRFRTGFAYKPSPVENLRIFDEFGSEIDQKGTSLIMNDIKTFGLGIGYNFGELFLDLAYQYHQIDYLSVFGGFSNGNGNATNGSSFYDSITGTELNRLSYYPQTKTTFNNFILTLGWNF